MFRGKSLNPLKATDIPTISDAFAVLASAKATSMFCLGTGMRDSWGLASGYVKIAIENGHWALNMVIFHSYVSLPEGI